jgi:signal transduction histidine kinase
MNKNPILVAADAEATTPSDAEGSTIRSQLLCASVFPLIFFGLLTTLVISNALYQLTENNALQRNTAQVQVMAALIEQDLNSGQTLNAKILNETLQSVKPGTSSRLYLLKSNGVLLADSGSSADVLPLTDIQTSLIAGYKDPLSKMMDSTVPNEKLVVSITSLSTPSSFIVLAEPWDEILSTTKDYQFLLIGLWVLGISFSLGMLSISISRVVKPIAVLVKNATSAVPGSIFHPIPQSGPKEIRALINEFNQMVIRLAEQQSTLRQYAHKALLSQEEERQRLSHELHDGTLQDMVGLVQRVELCRNDIEVDPVHAKQRLDDLRDLLNKTIEDIRRMSIALRPPVLEDFGLSVALDALCKDLKQDKPALQIHYSVKGENQRLQPDLELAVYRVVQEALANIRKHVKDVSVISVELVFGQSDIKAVVMNNGAEFSNHDVKQFVQSGHLGLAGMYERARLFGGKLKISTDQEKNTVVSIQMPYLQ